MPVATQLVAKISVEGASQAQSTFNKLDAASDTLGRKLSSIKPFQAGNSIAGTDVARARLNQLEVQVQAARNKLQTLQGAGNVGESIRNLTTAQARLKLLESDAQKAREQLFKLQDAADAGQSVTGIPEAEAKLAILSNKAAEAREKVAKIQNAADAGQSVKGVPEAQARLGVLEAKAAEARQKLGQIETGGREANTGISLVSSAAQRVNISLQSMASAASEATVSISNKLSGGLRSLGSGLLGFIQNAGMTVFSLQQIGQTALGLGQKLLAPNIQAENARVSFQAFIKDGNVLNTTLKQLSTFAAKTSFQFPDIQNASLKFLNMGVEANKLQGYLTKVGDAVAKVNGDGNMLNDVATILGQMSMKGKITTEDMQQLTERNIPAFKLLAQSMHVSESALQDMITKGQVGKDKIDLLVAAMGKWGNGAMQAQGKTFSGLWSTVTDSINMALGAMTGPLFDLAKAGLQKLVDVLGSKQFSDFTSSVAKGMGDAFKFIGDTGQHVWDVLKSIDLTDFKEAWKAVSFEVEYVGRRLGEFLAKLAPVKAGIDPIATVLGGLAHGVLDVVTALLWKASEAFISIDKATQQGKGPLVEISNAFKAIAPLVSDIAPTISDLATQFGNEFGPSLQKVSALLAGEFGHQLKDIGKVAQDFGVFFKKDVVPALKDAEPGFTALAHAALDMAPAIMKIRGIIMDVVEHGFKVFGPIIEKIVPPLIRFAGVLSKDIADGLKFIMPYVMDAAKAIGKFADEVIDRAGPFVTKVFGDIQTTLGVLSAIWKVVWPGLSQVLSGVWDEIVGIIKIAWAIVSGIIKIGLDLLSGNWKQAWEDFKTMLAGIWDGIKTYLQGAWKVIGGIFQTAWDGLKAIWGGVGGWFQGRWNEVLAQANNLKGKIGDALQAPFRAARDNIGPILKAFANGAIDQFNNAGSGLAGFVNLFADGINAVANALGAGNPIKHWNFPKIAHYASGTGGHPGGPAVLGDGGGPELTMANGKPYLFGLKGPMLIPDLPAGSTVLPADKTRQLMKGGAFSGIPAYAGGIGDIGSQIWDWISGGAKSVVEGMMNTFHISTPHLPGKLNDMAGQILSHVKDWAVSWVGKILPDFSGGAQGGGSFGGPAASGDLKKWILQAMALTHAPGNWLNALATIAQYESGGNPLAQNNWDVNAQNGDPSRGLFQTIMSTFMAHALPGHLNIFNPVDNAAAAIGYIKGRYGDVFHVPGIMALAAGKPYVGYKNGGWLNEPIVGMGLRTGTPYSFVEDGRPEYVSPAGYMPAGTSAIASGAGSAGGVTHIHTHVTAEIVMDGKKTARVLMPEIVTQIRNATGARF